MNWEELKIENLQRQLNEAESIRQHALTRLIDRDIFIADMEYTFNCAKLLLEESINFTGDDRITKEMKDSYLNRTKGFLAVYSDKQAAKGKFEQSIDDLVSQIAR